MQRLMHLLYPELRRLPVHEQPAALAHARATEFDAVELGGLALGLLLTTAVTRYAKPESLLAGLSELVANFLVAVPLLVVLTGPFFVRRTRRGLREYLARDHNPGAYQP